MHPAPGDGTGRLARMLRERPGDLYAVSLLLDDGAFDSRPRCGGGDRLDETGRLVRQFLGAGRMPCPAGGELPPLPMDPAMVRWHRWGRETLRDGDIVFRLGDARAIRGILPLSRFIARATGSPFSHTGIVAIENEIPVVYDCSSAGIQRQPFEVWMLDCIGPWE